MVAPNKLLQRTAGHRFFLLLGRRFPPPLSNAFGLMDTLQLDALKYSLQALAQPATFQHQLLSVWLEDVSELPERFVQAERHMVRGESYEFTAEQRETLAALHAKFESFCGPANADHWQDQALDWSPHWSAIRELAVRCLMAFAWPSEQPPLEIACFGEDYHE